MTRTQVRGYSLALAALVLVGAALACDNPERDSPSPQPAPTSSGNSAAATSTPEAQAGDEAADTWPVEDCLALPEPYSVEYSAHEVIEGTGVTSCHYHFTVRNEGDEDKHLIIYETFSAGEGGTQSEGWRVRHLGAHGTFEDD